MFAVASTPPTIAGEDLEDLLGAIIQLHSTSPTFKQLFKSAQVTQQFIDTHSAFASAVKSLSEISQRVTGLVDKMCHLAIALALDPLVSEPLQAEVIKSSNIFVPANFITVDGGHRRSAESAQPQRTPRYRPQNGPHKVDAKAQIFKFHQFDGRKGGAEVYAATTRLEEGDLGI